MEKQLSDYETLKGKIVTVWNKDTLLVLDPRVYDQDDLSDVFACTDVIEVQDVRDTLYSYVCQKEQTILEACKPEKEIPEGSLYWVWSEERRDLIQDELAEFNIPYRGRPELKFQALDSYEDTLEVFKAEYEKRATINNEAKLAYESFATKMCKKYNWVTINHSSQPLNRLYKKKINHD